MPRFAYIIRPSLLMLLELQDLFHCEGTPKRSLGISLILLFNQVFRHGI